MTGDPLSRLTHPQTSTRLQKAPPRSETLVETRHTQRERGILPFRDVILRRRGSNSSERGDRDRRQFGFWVKGRSILAVSTSQDLESISVSQVVPRSHRSHSDARLRHQAGALRNLAPINVRSRSAILHQQSGAMPAAQFDVERGTGHAAFAAHAGTSFDLCRSAEMMTDSVMIGDLFTARVHPEHHATIHCDVAILV